jgi:hypothetical protein
MQRPRILFDEDDHRSDDLIDLNLARRGYAVLPVVDGLDGLNHSVARTPAVRMLAAVERLREALAGVAKRRLPGDPLPCFCVDYAPGRHDVRCEDARDVLAEANGLPRDL